MSTVKNSENVIEKLGYSLVSRLRVTKGTVIFARFALCKASTAQHCLATSNCLLSHLSVRFFAISRGSLSDSFVQILRFFQ